MRGSKSWWDGWRADRQADRQMTTLLHSLHLKEERSQKRSEYGETQAEWEVNGMGRKKTQEHEAELDEIGTDPGQVGPESGGQSGDTQGLAEISEAVSESVESLAEEDQAYEAEVVDGVEEAEITRKSPCAATRTVVRRMKVNCRPIQTGSKEMAVSDGAGIPIMGKK